MRITNLRIHGFRSLYDIRIDDLTDSIIFFGDNNSGKSNILRFLRDLFSRKSISEVDELSSFISEDDQNSTPIRKTPFWSGNLLNYSENFYLGGHESITFEVVIHILPSELTDLERFNILPKISLGHDYGIKINGAIDRDQDNGVMNLKQVTLQNKPIFERPDDGDAKWMGHEDPAISKEFGELLLSKFDDCFYIIPADRYINKESKEASIDTLTSRKYKGWLLTQYLTHGGYERYKAIKRWFESDPFNYGEISFLDEGGIIDVMVEDECNYRLPIESKGSGVQQILVLLGHMASSEAVFIGVEEPELNLSFRNQDALLTMLRARIDALELAPYQLFITSHSDHIGSREDLKRFKVEKDGAKTNVRFFTADDKSQLFRQKKWRFPA